MKQVTEERLLTIIEAYGANAARWPEAERDGALSALARSERCQQALREAQSLDEVLVMGRVEEPSSDLMVQVLASAADLPSHTTEAGPSRKLWQRWLGATAVGVLKPPSRLSLSTLLRPAALMLIAGVIGIGIGWQSSTPSNVESDDEVWEEIAMLDEAIHEVDVIGDLFTESQQ